MRSMRRGALSDSGAISCVVGDNVSKPWPTDRYIDMTGIKDHTVSNLNIVHAAFVTQSNQGPVICHLPESASMPGGKTILSTLQMEANGCVVVSTSARLNAGQQPYIRSPDGYYFPMSMSEGLSYLAIRPVRDEEWDTLPHTYLTKDTPWDPSQFDHAITPQWYEDLPGKPPAGDLPHDLEGNPTAADVTGASRNSLTMRPKSLH